MKYLLDTNVISALSPRAKGRSAGLVDRLDRMSTDTYLSAITSAEIYDGIAKAEREGARRKAAELMAWWGGVELAYGDRILSFDRNVAKTAGLFLDRTRQAGQASGFADAAIGATAQVFGLTLVTRNKRHFEPMGVALLDPFDA